MLNSLAAFRGVSLVAASTPLPLRQTGLEQKTRRHSTIGYLSPEQFEQRNSA